MLDTNVWLDLLWFHDPRTEALKHALDSRRVIAVGNAACHAEWLRVLGYPALRLGDSDRDALVAGFNALVDPVEVETREGPVPRCSDPDDQKFLQLAHDAGARWLLSRDRHLLSLAARCRRDTGFAVMTPQAWGDHEWPATARSGTPA